MVVGDGVAEVEDYGLGHVVCLVVISDDDVLVDKG